MAIRIVSGFAILSKINLSKEMESIINVVIIENDNLSRIGAAGILSNTGKIEICGLTRSVKEGIKLIQEKQPDVVVLNIDLLNTNEISIISTIKNSYQATKIVVVTNEKNKEVIRAAINSGADCYYCKNSQGENLAEKFIEAVFSAYNNESWIDPSINRILIENFRRKNVERDSDFLSNSLSSQEITCLKLVASGIKNDEVAIKMNLAEGTIRSYLHTIFTKLNVKDKFNAIRKGLQIGIITIADMEIDKEVVNSQQKTTSNQVA